MSAGEFFEPILAACAPIGEVETAFDAELAVSALLGGAYAAADWERDAAVVRFGDALVEALEGRDDALTGALLAALGGVAPAEVAERARAAASKSATVPDWAAAVGTAQRTTCWALTDLYGDQIEYVLCFEYPDEKLGGPAHGVCVLLDFNAGMVKDCWLTPQPERIIAECRRSADGDEDLSFTEVAPGPAAAAVRRLLAVTDELPELPESGSFAEERCVLLARLPDPDPSEVDGADDVVADFLSAPEAAVAGVPDDVVAACARLIAEFPRPAGDADRLRFSPVVAGTFLLDWAPRSAVVDGECVRALPNVLAAFARYAGRRTGSPGRAVTATVEAIAGYAEGFVASMANAGDGTDRPTAAQLARRLIADGVDPSDPDAVRSWLSANMRDN